MKDNLKNLFLGLFWGVLICVLISCLTSCKTQYVPVPEYHYQDSVRVIRENNNTIREIQTHVKDSMSMEQRGDTTIIKNFHYESKFDYNNMMKQILDSLGTIKKDSVRVPYPVEKKLTRWQQIKMDIGSATIGISIAAIILAIGYIVRWLSKRKRIV